LTFFLKNGIISIYLKKKEVNKYEIRDIFKQSASSLLELVTIAKKCVGTGVKALPTIV
jgi:hypothetical protein